MSLQPLGNYDPQLVTITVGGILVSGFVDGTFIKVEKNAEAFKLDIGADGSPCRTRSRDESGKVTLTIMQSSLVNDLLSAQHESDKALPLGLGTVPFMMKDLSGTTLVAAEQCWIVKVAPVEYGKDIAAREWVIESPDLRVFLGGN